MSNYITIISKEDIKVLPNWFALVLFIILALIVIIPTIIAYIINKKKGNNLIKVINVELISGLVAFAVMFASFFTIVPHLLEPSGRFRYKATVDKNKITVSEYEDFIEKYRPKIKDDIYYFETDDILEENK